MASSLKMKHFCLGKVLDISQIFDHVWHNDFLNKFKNFFSAPYYLILKLYLENRTLVIQHSTLYYDTAVIKASVP